MVFQYGSGRQQICAPQLASISGALGSSGTLYFYLQFRNDVGFNRPSTSLDISYTPSSGIALTLPGDCLRSGENILQYSVTVNTSDDPSTAVVLLNLEASDVTLPLTINLTQPEHIVLEGIVATPSLLPIGANRINGMVRQVSSTGIVYRYRSASTLPANGTTVLLADVGRWEQLIDGFSSFVNDTAQDTNGCDLNVIDILDPSRILTKPYSLNGGVGPSRKFWIRNETSETISQGVRVGFTVSINNQPASEQFESLLKVKFDGYVDPVDGILDTTLADDITEMEGINVVKDYQFGRTDLVLPKPLLPGVAYQVSIFPQFNSYELLSVPLSGTTISVVGFFFDEAGSYNDASAFIGDTMLPSNSVPGFRRVYPSSGLSVFCDEGSGTVAGYFFSDIGSNVIPGLVNNEDNQTIVINNNGTTYLSTVAPESNERVRAVVGTLPGTSLTSDFTTLGFTSNTSPIIQVTVPYPTQIDPNYPDRIAGTSARGTFNAEEVAVYIRQGGLSGEIRKFEGFAPTNTSSDIFSCDWADGTIVSTVETTAFGLWQSLTPTALSSSSSGATTYEAAISFVYLGNSVTRVSHEESDGVIPEFVLDLGDLAGAVETLQNTSGFWKQPIDSYAALKALLPVNLLNKQINRVNGVSSNVYELWTWDPSLIIVADDISYIRPSSVATDSLPGRWVKVSGGSGGGSGTPTNVTSGSREDLTGNLTLTTASPEVFSLDPNGADRIVTLYDGGVSFRKHLIFNRGSANTITIEDNSSTTIDVLAIGEQLAVVWDTVNWVVI